MKTAIRETLQSAAAPLLWYDAVAVALPVLNGAPLEGPFFEHALFVLLVPMALLLLAGLVRGAAQRATGT